MIGDVGGLGLFNGIKMVRNRQALTPAPEVVDRVILALKRDHMILTFPRGAASPGRQDQTPGGVFRRGLRKAPVSVG